MRRWCPTIETAQTKVSITRYAARCLPIKEARANIRDAARRAMAGLAEHRPLRLEQPTSLDVRWRNNQTARSVALMPGVELVDQDTTRFADDDYAQVDRVMKAMLHIALSPLNAGGVQMP
jgi:D-amino peptidase